MVCKNGGIYGFLGPSWVLITYNICPLGIVGWVLQLLVVAWGIGGVLSCVFVSEWRVRIGGVLPCVFVSEWRVRGSSH